MSLPESQAIALSTVTDTVNTKATDATLAIVDDDFHPTPNQRVLTVTDPSLIEQHYFSLNLKPMHLVSTDEYTLPIGKNRPSGSCDAKSLLKLENSADNSADAVIHEHKIALQHQSFRRLNPANSRLSETPPITKESRMISEELENLDDPSLSQAVYASSLETTQQLLNATDLDDLIDDEAACFTESQSIDEVKTIPVISKKITSLPELSLLSLPNGTFEPIDEQYLQQMAEKIEQTLADYRVKVEVVDFFQGPVITLYELQLAAGVKASRISALSRDLARALSVTAVRVVEVIPGKPYVGLELPNVKRQSVFMRELLADDIFAHATSKLTLVLGKDIAGNAVIADLAKMPHLLVAGTTGSGKSVGVNAMIISLLYKAQPDEVRFIMIDPKMLELSVYEGIPHLLTEVVTDMKDAANALYWCVEEMERRYKLMSALGVRNIAGYNQRIQEATQPIRDPFWKPQESFASEAPALSVLPAIVVIVDEFADLIMAVGKKVEELIARLAQKARAAGIHLILATQRPSVDVITGLIKANVPTRIAFTVSSKIDSRTILDQSGAESLLGMGDMLYLAPGSSIPTRVHGAFVKDEEVHAVVQDWKSRQAPQYIEEILATRNESGVSVDGDGNTDELDPLFDETVAFIIDRKRVSISSVQRQFRIGYNRAARIVEQMEQQGIISAPSHNGTRDILARLNEDY